MGKQGDKGIKAVEHAENLGWPHSALVQFILPCLLIKLHFQVFFWARGSQRFVWGLRAAAGEGNVALRAGNWRDQAVNIP